LLNLRSSALFLRFPLGQYPRRGRPIRRFLLQRGTAGAEYI